MLKAVLKIIGMLVKVLMGISRSFAISVFLFFLIAVSPVSGQRPSHLDPIKNPRGCAACHKGHGKKGTSMLRFKKAEFCFSCHGLSVIEDGMQASTDMASVFSKRSRHPVRETSIYHVPGEDLPERNPGTRRHVACVDCHRTHVLEKGKTWKGVRGYTSGRVRGRKAEKEYETCYLCHSDSANRPFDSTNTMEEFNPGNPSYHPVERAGQNRSVPSLIRPLSVHDTVKCSDCHGNDDPYGPQGPHGSEYDHLLRGRNEMTETAESADAYELCYSCHDRRSVLDNESFQRHKEHIVYNHTPCSACHTPHGSRRNKNLIRFDPKFLEAIPPPTYIPGVTGRPTCEVTCHTMGKTVVHDGDFYLQKNWP